MEFEEMVVLFNEYDIDKSNTIDKHETRKILSAMGMEASLKEAEDLLAIIDEDGSGEISFDEFCGFIIMIKKGDKRVGNFGGLLGTFYLDKITDIAMYKIFVVSYSRDDAWLSAGNTGGPV
jgi:hypothetical protein